MAAPEERLTITLSQSRHEGRAGYLSERDAEMGELFRSYLPQDLAEEEFDFYVRVATEHQGSEIHELLQNIAEPYLGAVKKRLFKEIEERKEGSTK